MKNIDVDRAIELINRQIGAIEREQALLLDPPKKGAKRGSMATSKLTSQVMTLARGLATLLAEMRKAGDDVDEKLKSFTPDREAALALRLVRRLSPEHRAAVALHIQELDGKMISHAG